MYALLIGRIHHHNLILVGNQLTYSLVDFFQCHLTIKLLGQFPLLINRHQRFARQEMVHTKGYQLGIGAIMTFVELTLIMIQAETLGTIQF